MASSVDILGVSRETVSRWARGVNEPSLEALQRAAAAAGQRLVVDVEPADPELVELVRDISLISRPQIVYACCSTIADRRVSTRGAPPARSASSRS